MHKTARANARAVSGSLPQKAKLFASQAERMRGLIPDLASNTRAKRAQAERRRGLYQAYSRKFAREARLSERSERPCPSQKSRDVEKKVASDSERSERPDGVAVRSEALFLDVSAFLARTSAAH